VVMQQPTSVEEPGFGDGTPGAGSAGEHPPSPPTTVSRPWLTRLLGVVRSLGRSQDLQETLQHIADGVVEVLEFGAAAINVTLPDGDLRCDAVAGPPGLAEVLLHAVGRREVWDRMLGGCDRWGSLLFLPEDRQPPDDELTSWVPALTPRDDPDAWRPGDSLFAPLLDQDGNLLGVLSVDDPAGGLRPDPEQRTVLELFAAEAAHALSVALRRAELRDSEVVFRRVFEEAPVPMAIAGADLSVLHANDAFCELVAVPREAVGAHPLTSLVTPEDSIALVTACRRVIDGRRPSTTVEHRLVRADALIRWVRSSVTSIDTERGGRRLVIRVEDITEDRRALEELRRLADHDPLTGLPNRRIGRRRLEQLLSAPRRDRLVVVLYCDLDGFKAVNDEHGHAAGDELLALVAARLSRVIRPPDLLCREGGDEFVVIATMAPGDRPEVIAQRCVDALTAPFGLNSGPATVTLSVGLAVAGGPGVGAAELLRQADAALYRAKSAGRNQWAYATASPA
ncbi:MAG TPA: sensor domain-containing diguanylate cyclase, partial [Acidimicrobiales bacterium]|nr:sensor domain-containing diguanylate cyclase [Acidimicrobiales bacterium]